MGQNSVLERGDIVFGNEIESFSENQIKEDRQNFLQSFYRHMTKNGYCFEKSLFKKPPRYDRPHQMTAAASKMARFHFCAKGFQPAPGWIIPDKRCSWVNRLDYISRQINEHFNFSRGQLSSHMSHQFENWILERSAISLSLLSPVYDEYAHLQTSQPIIRVGNVGNHSFGLENDNIFLVDWSNLSLDLYLIDLWQLLRRTLRHNRWQLNVCEGMLNAYQTQNPLHKKCLEILYALMYFPIRHWRVIIQNSNPKLNKVKINRLYREINWLVDQMEEEKKLLNEFGKILGVSP